MITKAFKAGQAECIKDDSAYCVNHGFYRSICLIVNRAFVNEVSKADGLASKRCKSCLRPRLAGVQYFLIERVVMKMINASINRSNKFRAQGHDCIVRVGSVRHSQRSSSISSSGK